MSKSNVFDLKFNIAAYVKFVWFQIILSIICAKSTLVPDTEDEEESSFVEGPKPTEEERDKISDDVGKAIVENYTELEELKKKKDEKKSDKVDGAVSSKKEGTDPTGVIKKEFKSEKMDVENDKNVENASVKAENGLTNGHAKDIKKEKDEKMDVEKPKDEDTKTKSNSTTSFSYCC